MPLIRRTYGELIMSNAVALKYARRTNTIFTSSLRTPIEVPTYVSSVWNNTAAIDLTKLSINVPIPQFLFKYRYNPSSVSSAYNAMLAHENYHVVGPPFGVMFETFHEYIGQIVKKIAGKPIDDDRAFDVPNIVEDIVLENMILNWGEIYSENVASFRTKIYKYNSRILEEKGTDPLTTLWLFYSKHAPNIMLTKKVEPEDPKEEFAVGILTLLSDIIRSVDPVRYANEYASGELPMILEKIEPNVVGTAYLFLHYLGKCIVERGIFKEYAKGVATAIATLSKTEEYELPELPEEYATQDLLKMMKTLAPKGEMAKIAWVTASLIVANMLIPGNAGKYGKVSQPLSKRETGRIRYKKKQPGGRRRGKERGSSFSTPLLPPDVARAVADKLLRRAIVFPGTRTEIVTTMDMATVPFLATGGTGVPIATTFENPIPTEWQVTIPVIYESSKVEVPVSEPPTRVTIVIDVSGSTIVQTSMFSHLTNGPIAIADAERVVALAFLRALQRMKANTKVNLVKFSTRIYSSMHKLDDAEKELAEKASDPRWYEFGGTDIIGGVSEALKHHIDGPRNPIIILTDLEIEIPEANAVYDLLMTKAPRSPKLLAVLNRGSPSLGKLEMLNTHSNSAVVIIRSIVDVIKLERAMRKVSASAFT